MRMVSERELKGRRGKAAGQESVVVAMDSLRTGLAVTVALALLAALAWTAVAVMTRGVPDTATRTGH